MQARCKAELLSLLVKDTSAPFSSKNSKNRKLDIYMYVVVTQSNNHVCYLSSAKAHSI